MPHPTIQVLPVHSGQDRDEAQPFEVREYANKRMVLLEKVSNPEYQAHQTIVRDQLGHRSLD